MTLTATAGVWTLSGANAYSGATTVNGGGGTLVLSGTNSSANATTLTTGTLRLTNTAALANSALTLAGGTLQLRSDNANDTFATASAAISSSMAINVDRLANGSNNTIKLGAVSVTAAATATLTVSAGNGYALGLGAVTQTRRVNDFNAQLRSADHGEPRHEFECRGAEAQLYRNGQHGHHHWQHRAERLAPFPSTAAARRAL